MRTCEVVVDGVKCETKHEAKGMCNKHYLRMYQYGRLERITPTYDSVCSAENCSERHYSKGYCEKHHARYERHGDPLVVKKDQSNRGTDNITYTGSHTRLLRTRGRAAEYDCVDCGGPAGEWSYDHADPNELRQMVTNGKGHMFEAPYSSNPDHYEPRCKPCHVVYDKLTTEQPTTQEVT